MYICLVKLNRMFSRELIAASSIPLVLAVLTRGESYGYDIIRQIREASDGDLQFSDGTLYPVLRKLEDKELILSEWKIADNEKRRRYYILTTKGKEYLKQEQASWGVMNELLIKLWKPAILQSV
jgi:DNA-binding PadR family transcriptional regulator